jgi:hypothetical protein
MPIRAADVISGARTNCELGRAAGWMNLLRNYLKSFKRFVRLR